MAGEESWTPDVWGGGGGGWKVGEAKCLEEGRVRIPSLQVYLLSSSTYIKKATLSRK